MSSHRLYLHVVGWIVYLALYSVVYFVGVVFWDEMKWTKALANLIPVSLALPAVGLAAAFQRRNSYLQALRDLWGRLVPAAQVAIQYTHLNDPGQSDFARTQFVLSSANTSLADLLENGTLSEEDFALGRSASNPVRRPPA